MIHNLAVRCAAYIAANLSMEVCQREVVAYGLEVILGGTLKVIILLIVPFILGIFPQVWIAYFVLAFFRVPAGGPHCTAYYRCLIWTVITLCSIGGIAKYLTVDSSILNLMFYIAMIIGIIEVILLVPADTETKPITRLKDKRRAKVWSLSVLIAYFLLWHILDLSNSLRLAACLILLFQQFMLTPWGYKFMARLDQLLIINRPLHEGEV